VKVSIGDLVVVRGDGNPYTSERVEGPERRDAIWRFQFRREPGLVFWFAPPGGGAKTVRPEDINWATMPYRPDWESDRLGLPYDHPYEATGMASD
jgi:hypothetical protein